MCHQTSAECVEGPVWLHVPEADCLFFLSVSVTWWKNALLLANISKVLYKLTEVRGWFGRTQVCVAFL